MIEVETTEYPTYLELKGKGAMSEVGKWFLETTKNGAYVLAFIKRGINGQGTAVITLARNTDNDTGSKERRLRSDEGPGIEKALANKKLH